MAASFKILTAALAALALASACTAVSVESERPAGERPLVLAIGDPSTRSLLASDQRGHFGSWEKGDRLGTFVAYSGGNVTGYSSVTPGTPATVTVYGGYRGFYGGEKVYAYYPYDAGTKVMTEVGFSIPVSQVQSGEDFDFDAMPMVAEPYTVPASAAGSDSKNYPVSGEIRLANLAGVAGFKLFSSSSEFAGQTVVAVSFEADGAIAGNFTKNISQVDLSDPSTLSISGYTASSVTTTVSSAPAIRSTLDEAFTVYMVVAPGTYGGTLTVTTDKAEFRFPLSARQTFLRSQLRTLGVDLGSCKDVRNLSTEGAITVSKTISEILAAMGKGSATGGEVVNPLILDDVISISTSGTGNNGKVYGTAPDQNWRLYTSGGGNIIVSAASGYELRSVSFTHGKTSTSASDYVFGGPSSGVSQSVSGRFAAFPMQTGNMALRAVSVTYVPAETAPEVRTGVATDVNQVSAVLNASYSDIDTGHAPQGKGFMWGTSPSALTAEVYDDETLVTSSDGSYSVSLTSLAASTTYYYQAFMTVWTGSGYETICGSVMSFTTAAPVSASDRAYLDCYEMPYLAPTASSTGKETFGSTKWYEFDVSATRKVITHTFASSGKVVRNYTSCVDQTKRCPIWVAYAMHDGVYPNNGIDRGSFNENTSYDPGIPASWQSSGSTSDYNGGEGYARGHLCASADRRSTEDANNQTFYYTNQVPQRQNRFNDGVWSSLEDAVRKAAPTGRDTLYVVSGALFEDGNTGASNDGGTVARPSHLYKLLMLCSFDSSGKMSSAKGAAYIYENKQHYANYYDQTYKTTIDAIEERAGFDFFAAVPAELQSDAEAAFSSIL